MCPYETSGFVVSGPAKLHRVCVRSLDFALAAATFIFMMPLLAVVSLWIWLSKGSPILQREERVGRDGKVILQLRFKSRTLLETSGLAGAPALWNVLRGDLSLVGPQACLLRRSHQGRIDVHGGKSGLLWPAGWDADQPVTVPIYLAALFNCVPKLLVAQD